MIEVEVMYQNFLQIKSLDPSEFWDQRVECMTTFWHLDDAYNIS